MRPDELWEGQSGKNKAFRTVATPLSWLYSFGWQCYLATYALGINKSSESHRPVLCVGSLLVGGAGKSPLTVFLAKLILGAGRQVVIGSSGYGAPHSKDASVAPGGPLSAANWGDEPSMFRWLLPDVPQVVGRNRVLAAQMTHEAYPNAVLIMDDGFQHLPIRKHGTLLIDDSTGRNRACLPAGPYREPRRNRRRADAIIPDDFTLVREPMRIVTPSGSPNVPDTYAILCAVGQPSRFIASLTEQFPNCLPVPPTVIRRDHDPLTEPGLWSEIPSELPIVVTAKDWVKLRDRTDVSERQFLIALQEVRLEPFEKFKLWVEGKCDG